MILQQFLFDISTVSIKAIMKILAFFGIIFSLSLYHNWLWFLSPYYRQPNKEKCEYEDQCLHPVEHLDDPGQGGAGLDQAHQQLQVAGHGVQEYLLFYIILQAKYENRK